MCINSFGKFQHKKTKIKQKQNFSGETSFFQHKSNSSCKHITDNKMQVYYRECHLSCIRFFHRLFIHFENHTHLSLLSIYASIILSSSQYWKDSYLSTSSCYWRLCVFPNSSQTSQLWVDVYFLFWTYPMSTALSALSLYLFTWFNILLIFRLIFSSGIFPRSGMHTHHRKKNKIEKKIHTTEESKKAKTEVPRSEGLYNCLCFILKCRREK